MQDSQLKESNHLSAAMGSGHQCQQAVEPAWSGGVVSAACKGGCSAAGPSSGSAVMLYYAVLAKQASEEYLLSWRLSLTSAQ